jgi:hypothetical protein
VLVLIYRQWHSEVLLSIQAETETGTQNVGMLASRQIINLLHMMEERNNRIDRSSISIQSLSTQIKTVAHDSM